jgi:hypothetical protein
MDGPSPFGTLTVVPDELRQFAALAPLATISPVSAGVGATPPLSGPMPESMSPDAHVRFCVEHTCTVATSAASGISTLIDAALSFATSFETTDLVNASTQGNLTDPIAPAVDRNCWEDRDDSPAQA